MKDSAASFSSGTDFMDIQLLVKEPCLSWELVGFLIAVQAQ